MLTSTVVHAFIYRDKRYRHLYPVRQEGAAHDLAHPQRDRHGTSGRRRRRTGRLTQTAWRAKPGWAVVATHDHAINPRLLRQQAERRDAHRHSGTRPETLRGEGLVLNKEPDS